MTFLAAFHEPGFDEICCRPLGLGDIMDPMAIDTGCNGFPGSVRNPGIILVPVEFQCDAMEILEIGSHDSWGKTVFLHQCTVTMAFPADFRDLVPVILGMGSLDAVRRVTVGTDGNVSIMLLDQCGAMNAFRVGAEDILVTPAAPLRTL